MSRLVAAMSGGVDSSVAAALLAREAATTGDEVVGVWMRLAPPEADGPGASRSCCSPAAADDARRVAEMIGIPFFAMNVEAAFAERVIDAFADAYLEGTTPNPCQMCNQQIKFDELLRRAGAAYDASAVATGHYARREWDGDRWRLLRAADPAKDQTYFLWGLDQAQLAASRFPIGEMTKPAVRALAAELGFPTAATPDSQEICFVGSGDYRALLAERRGYAGTPGPIFDLAGARVGTHPGYAHVTVGQRHGLGIASGEPLYVHEVRAADNAVVVAPRAEMASSAFHGDRRHFIAGEPPADRFEAAVRIRHRAAEVRAEVRLVGADRISVETEVPVWAPAPGQAAVLYAGDECLGGARIVPAA